MPVDWARYPANWRTIRAQILARAEDRCERCGVPNHALIQRQGDAFWVLDDWSAEMACLDGERVTRVVLTIAHLGVPYPDGRPGNKHDKLDVRPENLLALCQRCHLREDMDEHRRHAAETRRKKRLAAGQQLLGLEDS